MIEIKHLKKEYPNITPIKDLSAIIKKGEIISIIGPSGTGKSTLLRCINRLEDATDGSVSIDGENIYSISCNINNVRKKMGMVFQSFNLFEHLTVIENIMVGPIDLLKKSKEEAREKALNLLDRIGLKDKANSYPYELSGGQKQRVAIMRTIAMEPEVILFDEPTSALDPMMIDEVHSVMEDLAKDGMTMLIVTHEMNFARSIANRVFYLDEGGIYEDGSPEEIFDNPKKEKTKNFILRLKNYYYSFDNDTFDLYKLNKGVFQYLAKENIDMKRATTFSLMLEEIICNVILVNNIGKSKINMSISIADTKDYAKLEFDFTGEFDYKLKKVDDLTMKIINKYAKNLSVDEKEKKLIYEIMFKEE